MELFYEPDCSGNVEDTTRTMADGSFSFPFDAERETVWVEVNYDTTSTCQWCTNWIDCVPDTICQMATSTDPGALIFNLNQPDCYCP